MSETTKPQINSAFGVRRSANYPCYVHDLFLISTAVVFDSILSYDYLLFTITHRIARFIKIFIRKLHHVKTVLRNKTKFK